MRIRNRAEQMPLFLAAAKLYNEPEENNFGKTARVHICTVTAPEKKYNKLLFQFPKIGLYAGNKKYKRIYNMLL